MARGVEAGWTSAVRPAVEPPPATGTPERGSTGPDRNRWARERLIPASATLDGPVLSVRPRAGRPPGLPTAGTSPSAWLPRQPRRRGQTGRAVAAGAASREDGRPSPGRRRPAPSPRRARGPIRPEHRTPDHG